MAGAGETPRRQTCARGLASGRGLRHSRDPARRLAPLPTTWRRNLSETFRFPAGIDRRASASPRRDQLPPEPRDPAWGRRVGGGPQSQTRRFRLRTERERFPPVASVSEPTGCHSGAATRLLPNPAVPFSSRGRAGAPTALLATLCDALTATRDVPGTRVASFGPPLSPPFCKTSHQSALKIGCTKSITMLPPRRSVSTWGGPRKVIPSEGPLEKISICSQDQKQPCPPTPPAGSAHVMVISLTESDHVSLLLLAA